MLRPPLASRSQIWSWYVAARTDVESANTELTRIEAEFAKFMAAHDETSMVPEMLRHGPSRQPVHRCGDANANGDAHARNDAHTHSVAQARSETHTHSGAHKGTASSDTSSNAHAHGKANAGGKQSHGAVAGQQLLAQGGKNG